MDTDIIVFPIPIQLEITDRCAGKQVFSILCPRPENILLVIAVAQIQILIHDHK